MSKKKCTIENAQFSWVMHVDRMTIAFTGLSNAEYFRDHYGDLGYEVIVEDPRGFLSNYDESRTEEFIHVNIQGE